MIYVGGRGIIRDNEMLLNAKAGIEIRSKSDPVVEKNKLAKVL
jgi:parallel beta-helix repeat protein